MLRLSLVLDALRASFWFVPTLMTVGAAGLAVGLLVLDEVLGGERVRALGWFYTGGAQGARSLLSMVAGAVVTVVGVAFSVTIVSLQLAAAQLGPRVLRNFMRDRGNQFVLGTFLATFVYCVLVLRTVRGADGLADDRFVPHLAVSGGVGLAIVSAAVLIYFIHHAAVAIQADHVIAAIAHELDGAIDGLYPERLDGAEPAPAALPALPEDLETHADVVRSPASGYVQSVDLDRVVALAVAHDLLVELPCRPGDFVIEGEPVARVWPAGRLDARQAGRLAGAVVLGRARTLVQDVRFGIEQLVEIAVRALSSDLRDPTTALRCIDRLGAAVARLGGRRLPAPRRDDGKRVRVGAPGTSLEEIARAAFDAIRARGAPSVAVLLHLLETFERVARLAPSRELHAALLRQTAMIERASRAMLPEWERQAVDRKASATRRAFRAEVIV